VFNRGFDGFVGSIPGLEGEFEQMARQYWSAWEQALRGGVVQHGYQAWPGALNTFQSLLESMPGMQGMGPWLRGVAPMLEAIKGEGLTWLNAPAVGFTREHQERLQALIAAQLEVQQATRAYQELVMKALQAAFQRFEQRLAQIKAEGREIKTPRELFDVWVDAAEDAYAEVALSPQYRTAYGNLINAQMRLRAGLQGQLEQLCTQLGMPTRSELDGAHRKIAGLERELRRMQARDRREARAEVEPRTPPGSQRPVEVKPSVRKTRPKPIPTVADKAASSTASKVAKKKAPAPAGKTSKPTVGS